MGLLDGLVPLACRDGLMPSKDGLEGIGGHSKRALKKDLNSEDLPTVTVSEEGRQVTAGPDFATRKRTV